MSPWKDWLRSKRHRRKGTRRRTSLSSKNSFHIISLHGTKQRVCLVLVNRFDTGRWCCWVGICTFGFEKKKKRKANPRIVIKETLKIWSRVKLSENLWEEYCAEKKLTVNTDGVSCHLVPLHLSIYDLKKIWLSHKVFFTPRQNPQNLIFLWDQQLKANYCLEMEWNPVESTLNEQLRSVQVTNTAKQVQKIQNRNKLKNNLETA